MHLPSHIANLNVLAGTPAPSPFRTLYPSAHPTTLSSTADDDAGLGNNGVDDPALEESLKRHLDLWINTEFSWTEDQAGAGAGIGGSPRDKVEGVFDAVDPQQLVGKDAEGEIEMDLMEYYKSRVKQGKEKNVLLDQRLGADDDKDKDEVRVGGEDRGTSVKEVQLVERGRRVETDNHVPVATPVVPSTTTTGGNVATQPPASGPAPDLASFLTQYSALLSSSIPSLDSLTPASGRPRASQAQRGQKQVEVEQVNRGGKDLEARSVDEQKKSSTSQSHSELFTPSSSNAVPSSDTRQQQQQSQQSTPRARHLHPPAPPINTPVLERAVPTSDPSKNAKSGSKGDDAHKDTDKLPGQEQNLMALLAAAFPQYASTFEAPAQQQQQQQHAAMNAFLLNHHASGNGNGAGSARSPPQHDSTPAATPFVYAPHDAGFGHGHAGMNFGSSHHQQQHQQLSGEIDRVFGSVDLGEGLYHHGHGHDESNANKTVDIVPSAQGGMELRRAGSASAGSLSDAASLHSFDTQAQRQHQLQNQNLVQQQLAVMSSSVTSSPQGKKRKLSDDSSVGPNSNSVYQPRYTQASLASLTAQAMGPGHPSSYGPAHAHVHAHGQGYGSRKRSMDSMEADLHDSGVLPDGVTPEEE
jgi:hypothetical protein